MEGWRDSYPSLGNWVTSYAHLLWSECNDTMLDDRRKARYRREKDIALVQEAQEAVQQGRSKVVYGEEDDLFGGTYDEESQSVSKSSESEMESILRSRKRKTSYGSWTNSVVWYSRCYWTIKIIPASENLLKVFPEFSWSFVLAT